MLRCIWIVVCCALLACGEAPETADGRVASKVAADESSQETPPYIETGDLDALRERGVLRLIAPRFDGADALPREGISVQAYQRLAETFAEELGLNAQWIFVDDFDDLIPALQQGRGDLVVTNLAVTDTRSQQVAFSRAINQVDEIVVAPTTAGIETLDDLAGVTVSVPQGTSYVSSLQKLLQNNPEQFELSLLPSSSSDADVLDALESGEVAASVLDSDIARQLLSQYPGLSAGPIVKRHRSIAWAVRSDSVQLLQGLNQFLVSHHLSQSARVVEKRDWSAIKRSGRLRVLTLNNPASYFMWRGDLMGFDYDLIRQFAHQQDLELAVVMKPSIEALFDALRQGEGDVIAASISASDKRRSQGLKFSKAYLKVDEILVARTGALQVSSLEQLEGKRLGVNPETVFYDRMQQWQQSINLDVLEYPGLATEQLLDKLRDGEFDATLADSHLLAIETAHDSDLAEVLTLEKGGDIAWVVRPEQKQLLDRLNGFISKEYRGLFYNVTYNKYFKNKRNIRKHSERRVEPGQALSPFDNIVKPLAKDYGMDWRLVISQMYQESRFDPAAESFAGALGLMQVLPRTGKEMGYTRLSQPEQGIKAGLAYMNWLKDRFPGEMEFQERIYFTLAAYNAGAGHVRDARRLAKQLGLDPNRWFEHTEKAMLLLSQRKYHKNARFGYVRGSEPVRYVREIRDRYLSYIAVAGVDR